MEKITMNIRCHGGNKTIEAYKVNDDFAIHKVLVPTNDERVKYMNVWRVSYIPFGIFTGVNYKTRKEAIDSLSDQDLMNKVENAIQIQKLKGLTAIN